MFFKKKERKVAVLVKEHIDKVEECLHVALNALESYFQSNINEAKKACLSTDEKETEADELRRKIADILYSGAYLPLLRKDIYDMVDSVDKIADGAESSVDFALSQRPEIPENLVDDFINITRLSINNFIPLKDAITHFQTCSFALSADDITLIREKIKETGILESDIDRKQWELTRKIFTMDIPLAHKIHLNSLLIKICNISDRVEDASDMLELLVIKGRV